MKNYDQVTNDLLERRNRYVAEQKKKRKCVMGVAASLCCCGLVALLGFGITKDGGVYAGGNENNTNNTSCGDYRVDDKNNNNTPSNNESVSVCTNENPSNNSIPSDDILGMVVIDGVTYVQFFTDVESYTLDTCLGSGNDYEGTYQGYLNGVASKLYTTKEDPDVLIVKLGNDGTVALKREKQ